MLRKVERMDLGGRCVPTLRVELHGDMLRIDVAQFKRAST